MKGMLNEISMRAEHAGGQQGDIGNLRKVEKTIYYNLRDIVLNVRLWVLREGCA